MDRLSSTAKKNYTELGLGNDLGHIKFGHINQKGDVTMGVCVGVGREGSDDSRHQLSFESDGKRKVLPLLLHLHNLEWSVVEIVKKKRMHYK